MPLFKFECEDCLTEFEELMTSSESPPPCPQCGSNKVVKQLSLVSKAKGGLVFPSTGGSKAPGCSGNFG